MRAVGVQVTEWTSLTPLETNLVWLKGTPVAYGPHDRPPCRGWRCRRGGCPGGRHDGARISWGGLRTPSDSAAAATSAEVAADAALAA